MVLLRVLFPRKGSNPLIFGVLDQTIVELLLEIIDLNSFLTAFAVFIGNLLGPTLGINLNQLHLTKASILINPLVVALELA